VPIPPLPEQARIAANIEELEIEAQRLEAIYQQKLTALAELKQSLLQKAFAGELTADAADAVDAVEAELA
jgi:type I restriction enzyme S subunit